MHDPSRLSGPRMQAEEVVDEDDDDDEGGPELHGHGGRIEKYIGVKVKVSPPTPFLHLLTSAHSTSHALIRIYTQLTQLTAMVQNSQTSSIQAPIASNSPSVKSIIRSTAAVQA